MISAQAKPGFETLAARLTAKARALAEASAESDALARQGGASRWRRAALLWPLFAKG